MGTYFTGLAKHAALIAAAAALLVCFSQCGSTTTGNYDGYGDGVDWDAGDWGDSGEFIWPDGVWPDGFDGMGPDSDIVEVAEPICTPGEGTCIDIDTINICNEDGSAFVIQDCPMGYVCIDDSCVLKLCEPGATRCLDGSTWEICDDTGTAYLHGGTCPEGEECFAGECYSPCDMADVMRSSVGCIYYAVDTNPMQPNNYAVAVSNTNETRAANVVIEQKDGGVWSVVAGGTLSVAPLALESLVLPHRYVSGSAIGSAYRITSDLPIIAYQFNPFDGSTSFLSDASLLLPKSALDTYHIVQAWPQGPADDRTPGGYPAHIQIAASAPTEVRVTSTIATMAGGGVPPLTPGVETAFALTEGDFLQLTVAIHMNSFTGTYIESDEPVAVFSSNDCVNVPASIDFCCCEHLEEQIFGLQTWGRTYVASRVPVRVAEPAVWQILGSVDGTMVTFDASPSVEGLPPSIVLGRGEWYEFLVNGPADQPGDFMVTADQPILVTQFMVGAFMVSSGGDIGDPSMVQAVPVDQYLDRYVVLVPDTWVNDFFVLTRQAGATITIDSAPVTATWTPVGTSIYEVARAGVSDGVHVVEGDQPFGVIVIGYDSFDSYAYPGGLNMQIINPV